MKAGVLALQGDFREHAASFALAGATPFLRLLSVLTAGHLMLQSAVLATDTGREATQVRTTRFFCEQLVPTGTALVPSITAGAEIGRAHV